MTNLTTQKIIEIHDDIIDKYGGERGIRNEGTIDYLIFSLNKPNNVIKMAALALYCITANHPFMDGCKRTGFEIADLLIREKGLHIHGAENEIRDALLKIAKYECTVGKIELWLKRNIRPLKTS